MVWPTCMETLHAANVQRCLVLKPFSAGCVSEDLAYSLHANVLGDPRTRLIFMLLF